MYIKQTYSTSTLLREQYTDHLLHLYTIRTDFQTAGRGQAGNSWESQDGKNLLFSTLLRYPELSVAEQWRISMLVAITIWEVLAKYLPYEQLTIKWPNDIYYGDNKLVGILIENTLIGGHISYSIAGVGVNVNQTFWTSNAPNPISMKQITGEHYDVETILEDWITTMQEWENRSTNELSTAYLQHIYRRRGWHRYVERAVSVMPTTIASAETEGVFMAELIGISQQGELILRTEDNEEKKYHFKQIRFVI